jgi:hypothetical protein
VGNVAGAFAAGQLSTILQPSNDLTGATDLTAINAAIYAAYQAGGGMVLLGAIGNYQFWVNGPVLMYPFVDLVGVNKYVTVKLAAGSNTDVLSVPNFSTLMGSGAASASLTTMTSGPYYFELRNLIFDGNRTNQTGGEGVRIYGWMWNLENVQIQNCYGTGLYTEWGATSGSALIPGEEMRFRNVRINGNGRHGWVNNGPTDAQVVNMTIFQNNQQQNACGVGFWNKSGGAAVQMIHSHIWGNYETWGIVADGSVNMANCEVEAMAVGQILCRNQVQMAGGFVFYTNGQTYNKGLGIQIGDDTTTAGLQTGNSLFPAPKSSYANSCKINTGLYGFVCDQTSRSAVKWVHGYGCDVAVVITPAGVPNETVHANSNATDVSTWTSGSPGTLSITAGSQTPQLSPGGGTATVVTVNGLVTFSYTGITGASQYQNPNVLSGCVAAGSPAAGSTVSTGAAVTLPVSGAGSIGTAAIAGTVSGTNKVSAVIYGSTVSTTYTYPASGADYVGVFGDMSDGVAVLDGAATVAWATLSGSTYTMTRDCFCSSLTINAGITLVPNGFFIFGGASVSGFGTIQGDGAAGAATGTAGAAIQGTAVQNAGGAGNAAAGTAGAASTNAVAVASGGAGAGGAGSSGAAGAGGNPSTLPVTGVKRVNSIASGLVPYSGARQLGGGGGGGGGGGDGTNKGGGGGAGGQIIVVFSQAISGLTITSRGGAGGTPTTGNCGGGGGGCGGAILLYSLVAPTSMTYILTAGSAGTGVGTGSAAVAGGSGHAYSTIVL